MQNAVWTGVQRSMLGWRERPQVRLQPAETYLLNEKRAAFHDGPMFFYGNSVLPIAGSQFKGLAGPDFHAAEIHDLVHQRLLPTAPDLLLEHRGWLIQKLSQYHHPGRKRVHIEILWQWRPLTQNYVLLYPFLPVRVAHICSKLHKRAGGEHLVASDQVTDRVRQFRN